jgi:hypothetical protein
LTSTQADEMGIKLDKANVGGAVVCRAVAGVIKKLLDDGASLSTIVTIPDGQFSLSKL